MRRDDQDPVRRLKLQDFAHGPVTV